MTRNAALLRVRDHAQARPRQKGGTKIVRRRSSGDLLSQRKLNGEREDTQVFAHQAPSISVAHKLPSFVLLRVTKGLGELR